MNSVERLLRTGQPVLRVTAEDEEAASREVVAAVGNLFGQLALTCWDASLEAGGGSRLEHVLGAAAADAGPSLYLLKDVASAWDAPLVQRLLRDLATRIGARPVRVVLLTDACDLPALLRREIPTADHALPSLQDLEALAREEAAPCLDAVWTSALVASALAGLTLVEARVALRQACAESARGHRLLARLFEDKARRVEGSTLEFVPPSVGFDDVGGLERLKEWARLRSGSLTRLDHRTPRGVLLMGVSGCGKSWAVKALGRELGAATFRLDVARVFAQPRPESAFQAALSAVSAMAPCVVWIDEIERAFAFSGEDSSASVRVTGSLLTWLQERVPGVFIAATANRIELLPAELLRRGRFDQIFFVDLPDEDARKRIWAIHLARAGAEPARFDLIVLSGSTPGWSGAEIEAAVQSVVVEAKNGTAGITKDALFHAIEHTVPLSVSMQESIKGIREWAFQRAIAADRWRSQP